MRREHREFYQRFRGHTMIWEPVFCQNLDLAIRHHQAGLAVVECGVWRGGMIAAIAAALGDPDSVYHLFDSFQGLPEAQSIDGAAAQAWQQDTTSHIYYDNCRASEEEAREAMSLASVPPERTIFHTGWFEDTLPGLRLDRPVSILRLDADWYASTRMCLEVFYPQVADGGLILIDDYYTWDGCARAVHDYLSEHKLAARIRCTDRDVAYIIKPAADQSASAADGRACSETA